MLTAVVNNVYMPESQTDLWLVYTVNVENSMVVVATEITDRNGDADSNNYVVSYRNMCLTFSIPIQVVHGRTEGLYETAGPSDGTSQHGYRLGMPENIGKVMAAVLRWADSFLPTPPATADDDSGFELALTDDSVECRVCSNCGTHYRPRPGDCCLDCGATATVECQQTKCTKA